MRVFLTGGTGFIGQALAHQLLRRGWTVTALVRRPNSGAALALTRTGARCVHGDVTDIGSLRPHMAGSDLVIHGAGHHELGVNEAGRRRMQEANVRGTENVLEMARALDIPRTVYVSSVTAYGDSGPQARDETFTRTATTQSWYEYTKTQAHRVAEELRDRGLPIIIVCPSSVIGPNDHSEWGYLLRLYLAGRLPPVAWAPHTRLGVVGLQDVAQGVALAAERGRLGETYILNAETLTSREHLAHWARFPGGLLPRLWLPASLANLLMWPLEPVQRLLGLPAFLSRETVLASSTHHWYDSGKARAELGWSPIGATRIWTDTIQQEMALAAMRQPHQGLVGRLHPLPPERVPEWVSTGESPQEGQVQAA